LDIIIERHVILFIYLFIRTRQMDQEASNTVGNSTNSKQHMGHTINKTQVNRTREKETKHYT